MSWTQAICWTCWTERHPDREAIRVVNGDPETCSYCGNETTSGIYVRDDPAGVPFPRQEAT